jgi:hypothetical protein
MKYPCHNTVPLDHLIRHPGQQPLRHAGTLRRDQVDPPLIEHEGRLYRAVLTDKGWAMPVDLVPLPHEPRHDF